MTEQAPKKAKVAIIDPTTGTKTHVQLPVNVTVQKLMPHLINALKLRPQGAGGGTQQYDLILETTGEHVRLEEDRTLADQGVVENGVLRITPRMTGGGKVRAWSCSSPTPPIRRGRPQAASFIFA